MGRPPKKRSSPEPLPVEGARWIPLTKNMFALVDEEDYEKVSRYSWCVDENLKTNYASRRSNTIRIRLHRWLLNEENTKTKIDHIDGNGLNNRRSNLRIASCTQNNRNKRKFKITESKFKGVRRVNNRWCAQIGVNYKNIHLGYFSTQEEAAAAYDRAAQKFFQEFALTNEQLK